MRLIHIDKPCCRHMSKIVPAVSAVYQMEQEFFPYLFVEFKPNDGKESGVLLQTQHGDFRKAYDFDSPKDVENLRQFIWTHVKQDYKIRDITDNGCLTSFKGLGRNTVINSWKDAIKHRCTNCFKDTITEPEKHQMKGILHQAYQLCPMGNNCGSRSDNAFPAMNKDICLKVRNTGCDRNFPKASLKHHRCNKENQFYCANAFPEKGDNMKNIPCNKSWCKYRDDMNKNSVKKLEGFGPPSKILNKILDNGIDFEIIVAAITGALICNYLSTIQ